jgi:hypothetical protein
MNYKKHPLSGYSVSIDGEVVLKPSGDPCTVYQNKCPYSGKPTYYSVCGRAGGRGGHFSLVHRLVYETYVGVIPAGMVINHLNGIKTDNRLCNLELCTYKENSQHMVRMGLNKPCYGETNGMSKLKDNQISDVYKLLSLGYNNEAIAELYNLHSRYVSLIRHGHRWKRSYKEYGKVFPKSFKFKIEPNSIIHAWCLIKEGYRNMDITEKTGIERSIVSRIRTGSAYKSYIDFYESKN